MPRADFTIGQGDTASKLSSQLLDADSNPVNIQGGSVRFRMLELAGGTVLTVDAGATIVNGTIGEVEFAFGTLHTAAAGWYQGQWEVTYAGGSIQTFPEPGYILILIEEQLG